MTTALKLLDVLFRNRNFWTIYITINFLLSWCLFRLYIYFFYFYVFMDRQKSVYSVSCVILLFIRHAQCHRNCICVTLISLKKITLLLIYDTFQYFLYTTSLILLYKETTIQQTVSA